MTSEKEPLNNFEQFMQDINEKIRADLLIEGQKIIAFNTSEASTNFLEYFFHKKNLISDGFKLNHNYFASEKRAERYLDFEFPNKKELIQLMANQEELRNLLCYGKEKQKEKVNQAIINLNKITDIIKKELGEENETK